MKLLRSKFPDRIRSNFESTWENYLLENPHPKEIILEVTNECTVATCSHCYIAAKSIGQGKYLPISIFNQWADAFKKLGKPLSVLITGGEPTLHPQLVNIIKRLKQLKIKTILVSNGITLTDQNIWPSVCAYLDEIQISLRGYKLLHDVLTLSAEDELWKQIPQNISLRQQIETAIDHMKNKPVKQYELILDALLQITKIKLKKSLKLSLNVDIQASADLVECVDFLNKKSIKIDDVYLQVMQPIGRAKIYPDAIPNLWRKPDEAMVKKYFIDAQYVLRKKMISGKVTMIDSLPTHIVEKLHFGDIKYAWFYRPHISPAISVNGHLRPNVVG